MYMHKCMQSIQFSHTSLITVIFHTAAFHFLLVNNWKSHYICVSMQLRSRIYQFREFSAKVCSLSKSTMSVIRASLHMETESVIFLLVPLPPLLLHPLNLIMCIRGTTTTLKRSMVEFAADSCGVRWVTNNHCITVQLHYSFTHWSVGLFFPSFSK